jgi:CMP-N,N'-diacetyllegionaminic acid synthase
MNLLFTVCGRAGSKGFQNKNISTFLGLPLPYYSFSAIDLFIKQNGDKYGEIMVAVNTDSTELLSLLANTNVRFISVPRKEELAIDTASKILVIKDTLLECEKQLSMRFDLILDLDITSPLRTVEDIQMLLDVLQKNPQADVAFSVTNSRRNPYFNMVREQDGFFYKVLDSDFTTRQQAPLIYDMNASIYAYSRDFLRSAKNSIFDGKAVVHIMKDTAVLDIDSEEDFKLMEIIANYFYDTDQKYDEIRTNVRNIK